MNVNVLHVPVGSPWWLFAAASLMLFLHIAAGTLTFFLVAASWVAIRRKNGRIGHFENVGFVVALGVVISGVTFILMARNSPAGKISNTPSQALYAFVPVFSPLLLMGFWLIRVRLARGFKSDRITSP